jgi:hydrogenase nickel incorporation protein HypA/HybF
LHESSLAKQLVKVVLERAAAAGARKVREVRGWVAETEALSAESLGFHFEAHARGTPAEGARLELRLVHVEARCGGCGTRYASEHHLLLCPRCGASDGEFLGPTGVGIETLEVDDEA